MEKIRLTKGELKRQRDCLRQYQRYLPTLQLKKQQLQIEILRQLSVLEEKVVREETRRLDTMVWAGLLAEEGVDLRSWISPKKIITTLRNIAGIDLPVFEGIDFGQVEYDLFLMPLWVDRAIIHLQELISLQKGIETLKQEIEILRQELRITTQRVNLFEKIKIPQAEEAIRLIRIYLGDQMTNAVGRSKIAKRKIEQTELSLAAVGNS